MGRHNSQRDNRSGGNRGGGGRTGQRSGGSGRTGGGRSNNTYRSNTRTKTLADHIYEIGSAKQASDFVTNTNFILNHIRITFPDPEYIVHALEKLEDPDFEEL